MTTKACELCNGARVVTCTEIYDCITCIEIVHNGCRGERPVTTPCPECIDPRWSSYKRKT